MPAKKGQNNFLAVQKRIVDGNLAILEEKIRGVKRGTAFSNINAFINYLSQQTGLHRTTLKRNPSYYKKILVRFGRQPGAAAWVDIESADSATLQAKLLDLQIELREMRRENQALRRHVVSLTRPAEILQLADPGAAQPIETSDSSRQTHALVKGAAEASKIAMCLLAVLDRLAEKELGIVINEKTREIQDLSEEGGKRVVVSFQRAATFFHWLRENRYALELGDHHE